LTNQTLTDSLKSPIERRLPTTPKSGTLTKAHIIDAIAAGNGFTRKKSIETVETVLELIKQALESGDGVLISGFGKFCVRKKAKRKGRNPATGEDMLLAPRRVVTFQCSGILREKLNRKMATAKKRRAKR
jgi:integration host factor subunit alpha